MTTAHRVTYHPAMGSAHAGGFRYYVPRVQVSAQQQTAHSQVKYRQPGQNRTGDVQHRDLRTELELQERTYQLDQLNQQRQRQNLPLLTELPSDTKQQLTLTDQNAPGDTGAANTVEFDAAELSAYNDADDDTIEAHVSSDDSDSEDETALLQAELERIKQDRAAAKLKAEQAADAEKGEISGIELQLLQSNPLLAATHGIGAQTHRIGRSWTDDAVFRDNASDHQIINKVQKRFINDSVRSDFHRSFLRKYVRS